MQHYRRKTARHFAVDQLEAQLSYTTSLIERDDDDVSGQSMCGRLETQLTYWSTNGLDSFSLTPVVNDGQTVGVIVGARGENPSMFGASRAFMRLTGLGNASEIGEFLGVDADKVQSQLDEISRQNSVAESRKGNKSMGYITELLEREEGDTTGSELCNSVAMNLRYLSNNRLDNFLLLPVQNNGTTASIIVAARGARPTGQSSNS